MSDAEKRLRKWLQEVHPTALAQLDVALASARAEALAEAAQIARAEAEECDRLKQNADGYGLAGVRQCWQSGQTAAESIEGRICALITTPRSEP